MKNKKTLFEKIKDISEKVVSYENKIVKKEEKKVIKLSFFKLLTETFNITTSNFTHFAKIALTYSVVMTIVHTLLETGFACSYKGIFNNFDMKCDMNTITTVFYVIFHIFVFCSFSIVWQRFIVNTENKVIDYKKLFNIDVTLFKFLILNIITILLLLIPVFSLYLLYNRVPHQDYQIELLYFAFVASGFIVPFIVTRFTSLYSKIIVDGKIGSIKSIWTKTSGNNIKILSILLLIFLISVLTNSQLNIMLRPNFIKYPEITAVIGDLLNNMLFYFCISLFMNFSNTQRELLSQGANDNE